MRNTNPEGAASTWCLYTCRSKRFGRKLGSQFLSREPRSIAAGSVTSRRTRQIRWLLIFMKTTALSIRRQLTGHFIITITTTTTAASGRKPNMPTDSVYESIILVVWWLFLLCIHLVLRRHPSPFPSAQCSNNGFPRIRNSSRRCHYLLLRQLLHV